VNDGVPPPRRDDSHTTFDETGVEAVVLDPLAIGAIMSLPYATEAGHDRTDFIHAHDRFA
jgi:hypothetical protein